MKKLLAIIVLLMVMAASSCGPSAIQHQSDALDQAYQSGEISASDYYARKNELLAIQQQKKAAIGSAVILQQGLRQNH
jgi:hypothetical protein